MPVTTSVYLWDQEADSEVESDGRVVSKYTEVYLLKTNSMTRPSPAAITTALGIYPGSPYWEDSNATCHGVSIRGTSKKTRPPYLMYLISVRWSTNAPLNVSTSTDPTSRRTLWACRPNIQQRYVVKDLSGNLIVNTAGQPFDGGIPCDVRLGTVTANRNVTAAGYNFDAVMALNGAINTATFLGGPAGTVQGDVESVEHYEGAYHYYEETWTFKFDPLGLPPKIASAGFYQKNGSVLKRICEFDLTGTGVPDTNPVMEPEPLDASGILVPVASRPGSCAFVSPTLFPTYDFNSLGL